jgi:hypothetical protein
MEILRIMGFKPAKGRLIANKDTSLFLLNDIFY